MSGPEDYAVNRYKNMLATTTRPSPPRSRSEKQVVLQNSISNRSSRCAPHEVDSFRSGSRFVFHSFPFATRCALHPEVEACLQ
jgi:hypothetical protein